MTDSSGYADSEASGLADSNEETELEHEGMTEGMLTYSIAEIAFEDSTLHMRDHQLYYIGNAE